MGVSARSYLRSTASNRKRFIWSTCYCGGKSCNRCPVAPIVSIRTECLPKRGAFPYRYTTSECSVRCPSGSCCIEFCLGSEHDNSTGRNTSNRCNLSSRGIKSTTLSIQKVSIQTATGTIVATVPGCTTIERGTRQGRYIDWDREVCLSMSNQNFPGIARLIEDTEPVSRRTTSILRAESNSIFICSFEIGRASEVVA